MAPDLRKVPDTDAPPIEGLPRAVHYALLDYHKRILRLAVLGLRKGSDEFRVFRYDAFEKLWDTLGALFDELEKKGIVRRCECEASRKGRTQCPSCGGAGYVGVG